MQYYSRERGTSEGGLIESGRNIKSNVCQRSHPSFTMILIAFAQMCSWQPSTRTKERSSSLDMERGGLVQWKTSRMSGNQVGRSWGAANLRESIVQSAFRVAFKMLAIRVEAA